MNSRIRLSARAALNGSYFKIVPIITAVMFTTFVFSALNVLVNLLRPFSGFSLLLFSVFSLIIPALVICPLRLRLEIRHFQLARRLKGDVFLGFTGVLKSYGMCALLFLLKLFWFCFFEFIPLSAAAAFLIYCSKEKVSLRASFVIWAGIVLIAFVGLCFYAVYIQRYSKSMFFLACYGDMGVLDAVHESIRKTENKLREILFFKLGFLPWFFLCAGIVPALFVIPYYKQSITCRFLCDR